MVRRLLVAVSALGVDQVPLAAVQVGHPAVQVAVPGVGVPPLVDRAQPVDHLHRHPVVEPNRKKSPVGAAFWVGSNPRLGVVLKIKRINQLHPRPAVPVGRAAALVGRSAA